MRYLKQELIKDWDQEKLKKSNITLIGSDNLASFILIDLIAMGFGNINKIGKNSINFLNFHELNSDVEIQEIPGDILNIEIAKEYIGEPDFIIEASKSIKQKLICLKYAREKEIPVISTVCSDESYSIKVLKEKDCLEEIINFHFKEIKSEKDGVGNSIIASGIIVDELRKRIMPLRNENKLVRLLYYNENTKEEEIHKKVFLVGAGAIGTFAGISLALKGAEVDVIDFDRVEESNLNRQVLFYNSIGKYKSEVMAEKLSSIGKFRSIIGKVGEDYKLERDYDIILSCVDNSEARYYLDWISYSNKIPLINAGTSLFSGIVMPYFPGKTACLDCQSFRKISESKDEKKEGSCYEPSIIISNQIIGGLQVNKISKIFRGELFTTKYNSNNGIKNILTLDKCIDGCEKCMR